MFIKQCSNTNHTDHITKLPLLLESVNQLTLSMTVVKGNSLIQIPNCFQLVISNNHNDLTLSFWHSKINLWLFTSSLLIYPFLPYEAVK